MTNYNLGDFLIRLKNSALIKQSEVEVIPTKVVVEVAKLLKKLGFISEIEQKERLLILKLAIKNKKPVIMDIKLISKPGLRVYKSVEEIEKIRKPSTILISTSKGVMTIKEAIKQRVGGEMIAEIL